MIGYKSNMLWLPEHGVAPVVLTNSDPAFDGLELVVGTKGITRTLTFRDAQHEYTFTPGRAVAPVRPVRANFVNG